jgi:hypothetical protein
MCGLTALSGAQAKVEGLVNNEWERLRMEVIIA